MHLETQLADNALFISGKGLCGRTFQLEAYPSYWLEGRDVQVPRAVTTLKSYCHWNIGPFHADMGSQPECGRCLSDICQELVGARPGLLGELKHVQHPT